MIQYKIRNKSHPTLYREGGVRPRWTKNGKIWSTRGKLRSTITMIINYRTESFSDWEVVEYEVSELGSKDVNDIIDPKKLIDILTREN